MGNLRDRVLFVAAAFLSVTAMALAAHAQELTRDLTQIPGGKYKLDASHANVVFLISHGGFSTYVGRFNTVDGSLKFNVKNPTKSSLSVTIDANSVDTPSDALDEHLRKADFFNVEKFPTITFKSTKVQKIDDKTGRVTGDLTLLGVTKPVTLDVTFNGGGMFGPIKAYRIGFSARTAIKRSDFDMAKSLIFLGDDVSLIIEAEFLQAK
jgi:polyisoprenoid-binding protein YceI